MGNGRSRIIAPKQMMAGELIAGLLLILGAAVWRGISVWRNAPGEKHSLAEYADAFFFRDDDEAKR